MSSTENLDAIDATDDIDYIDNLDYDDSPSALTDELRALSYAAGVVIVATFMVVFAILLPREDSSWAFLGLFPLVGSLIMAIRYAAYARAQSIIDNMEEDAS